MLQHTRSVNAPRHSGGTRGRNGPSHRANAHLLWRLRFATPLPLEAKKTRLLLATLTATLAPTRADFGHTGQSPLSTRPQEMRLSRVGGRSSDLS